MIDKLAVVLRNNVDIETDVELARREFVALLGKSGRDVPDVRDLWPHSRTVEAPIVSKKASMVAMRFAEVSTAAVRRLLLKSAFAQEVLFPEPTDMLLKDLELWAIPFEVINGFSGRTAVALSMQYIIEVEPAFHRQTESKRRLDEVARLLLSPYRSCPQVGSESKRLRTAAKTTLYLTHDLHIYKAKFFPRMVRALLNMFAPDNATVLDPYVGSGTALLEASLLGHRAFGADIDPICVLISEAKVNPFFDRTAIEKDVEALSQRLKKNEAKRFVDAPGFPVELRKKLARRDARDGTEFEPEIVHEAELLRRLLSMRGKALHTSLGMVLASDAVTKKVRYRYIGVGNGKYAIEVVKQPALARFSSKLTRAKEIAGVMGTLVERLPHEVSRVVVAPGDARDRSTWPIKEGVDIILTSPPYLPASSGREHYASSRALAFHVLGMSSIAAAQLAEVEPGDVDLEDGSLDGLAEARRLMEYLCADCKNVDPQRDPMRAARKARPTKAYLEGMVRFFENCEAAMSSRGRLLLVVAAQHTFYSHRRGEVEHVVDCAALYCELANAAGLLFCEEIRVELRKASNSRARPRAKEQYYESILVFRRKRER